MSITFSRLLAAIILAVGGAMTALTGFGLVVADVVIRSGRFAVLPAEARAVRDLASVAPIIGILGGVAFLAAIALLVDARRARAVAAAVAAAGTAIGLGLVALVLSAAGPFASLPADRVLDGITIVGSYAGFNLVALIALAVDRASTPVRRDPDSAAGPMSASVI